MRCAAYISNLHMCRRGDWLRRLVLLLALSITAPSDIKSARLISNYFDIPVRETRSESWANAYGCSGAIVSVRGLASKLCNVRPKHVVSDSENFQVESYREMKNGDSAFVVTTQLEGTLFQFMLPPPFAHPLKNTDCFTRLYRTRSLEKYKRSADDRSERNWRSKRNWPAHRRD